MWVESVMKRLICGFRMYIVGCWGMWNSVDGVLIGKCFLSGGDGGKSRVGCVCVLGRRGR